MSNVLLGAIDQYGGAVNAQSGSSPIVITTGPVDMVTLPTDDVSSGSFNYLPGGPAGGGGDISIDKMDVPPVTDYPQAGGTDVSLGPKPMSKKNMLLFGIGALVLGYLILRKK